jgi:hypothetical protein
MVGKGYSKGQSQIEYAKNIHVDCPCVKLKGIICVEISIIVNYYNMWPK